ncbi:YggS family pyridoxal phosphate-dependent enzyme [Sporosarcina sp. HYO08]|uniref:YggS family pyridoxal phosphate-dependent enzyme n=1 Tax=Sporosarcina sp. HYO08 TaxID=1759557 RepID=UPI000796F8B5|nr:YggS family pyridoxal phosphate-dependent enzyme [Sporosarcina sp. HYO08]KXH79909.1 YggS family pyridoxal phosphate enzyme [Sporosarcina sp. HYO08]
MSNIEQRLQQIEQNIQNACERSGRTRSDITVIAVTKEVSTERAIEVMNAGILDLGENRTEGLLAKQESIQKDAKWHFIGNVQSRKVRDLVNTIHCLHSLDRMSLAKEIQKRADQPIDCFVQVNVSGEETKSGVNPEELERFIEEIAAYDKIHVIGLMTMAPFTDDMEYIRTLFRQMKELRDKISVKQWEHAPCTQLSMGMSNDYEIAIEEGATHVRIGTALVGKESGETT